MPTANSEGSPGSSPAGGSAGSSSWGVHAANTIEKTNSILNKINNFFFIFLSPYSDWGFSKQKIFSSINLLTVT